MWRQGRAWDGCNSTARERALGRGCVLFCFLVLLCFVLRFAVVLLCVVFRVVFCSVVVSCVLWLCGVLGAS
jgi:hypothetical protein